MKKFVVMLTGVSFGALCLTACTPPHPHPHVDTPLKVIAKLDCPDSQGDLTRKSAAADGKSCIYADDSGAQVTLQLIDLGGKDSSAVLGPIEAQLKTEIPALAASPGSSHGPDHGKVDIDLPGIHIHANSDDKHDGKADDDDGNVTINAKDGGSGVTIDAGDGGAVIHTTESGSGVRSTIILASDTAGPNGYKVAGYIARGPSSGPIAVAIIKGKEKDHDDLFHQAGELLKANVGG